MQGGRQEIRALTGLRAVAAFWVVLFHLRDDLDALHPLFGILAHVLAPAGYLGVDLFFVLSGFIISYNYADRLRDFDLRAYLSFLWARLARIYPVHLFTLAVLLAFVLLRGAIGEPLPQPERYSWAALAENLALLQAWALPVEKSWNVPAWSISAEWAAYLLFPLVAALALLLQNRWAIVTVSGLLFALAAIYYLSRVFPGTMAYGLLRLAVEFTVGCLLYRLYRQNCFRNLAWGVLFAAMYMAGIAAAVAWLGLPLRPLAWAPAALAMLVYALSSDRGWFCRQLSRPGMLYWGRVSYSLYMVHFVIILILHRTYPLSEIAALPLPLRAVLVGGLIAAILVAAALTYRYVEQPSRRWMRRRFPLRAALPASA